MRMSVHLILAKTVPRALTSQEASYAIVKTVTRAHYVKQVGGERYVEQVGTTLYEASRWGTLCKAGRECGRCVHYVKIKILL